MKLYARLREVFGIAPQHGETKRTTPQSSEEGAFLIRHHNPDGTISYEPTEKLMKAAALAASRVPPPGVNKTPI